MPDNLNTPTKPLTRDQFAAALRKGQGRALLHVLQYGKKEEICKPKE